MKQEGVDAWVTALENLFVKTGMKGIDWDIEGTNNSDTDFFNFMGDLSGKLISNGHVVTLTMSGNASPGSTLATVPDGFFTKYASSFTYIVLMLYGSGMWGSTNIHEDTWCSYVEGFQQKFPLISNRVLYALTLGSMPANGRNCCRPCLDQALDYINKGYGKGIAIWCYSSGGRLGTACGGIADSGAVIEAINNISKGSKLPSTLFTSCTGPLAKDPCAVSP